MVNLSLVLLDIVLRGGVPDATLLVARYEEEAGYPGVYGVSSVFHPGLTLDQLAQAAQFRHGQLHYATVGELVFALVPLGYEPVITRTPTQAAPDHCTLGVGRGGVTLQALPLDAAQALVAAFHRTPNPYRP